MISRRSHKARDNIARAFRENEEKEKPVIARLIMPAEKVGSTRGHGRPYIIAAMRVQRWGKKSRAHLKCSVGNYVGRTILSILQKCEYL